MGRLQDEDVRQLVHLALGAGAIGLAWIPRWAMAGLLVCAGLMVLLAGKIVHQRDGRATKPGRLLARLFRDGESRWNNGGLLYVAGLLLAVFFLPWRAAMGGWMILASGDAFANLAGRRFPVIRFGKKSLGGLAGFFLGAMIFTPVFTGLTGLGWQGWTASAAATGLVETFLRRANDNVWIPLFSGLLIFFLK